MGCCENRNDRDIHNGFVVKRFNETMEFSLLNLISFTC
jgi:hypothetical protein